MARGGGGHRGRGPPKPIRGSGGRGGVAEGPPKLMRGLGVEGGIAGRPPEPRISSGEVGCCGRAL